jgi:hypothetical protein
MGGTGLQRVLAGTGWHGTGVRDEAGHDTADGEAHRGSGKRPRGPVSRARARMRESEGEAWAWGESSGSAGPFIERERGGREGAPREEKGRWWLHQSAINGAGYSFDGERGWGVKGRDEEGRGVRRFGAWGGEGTPRRLGQGARLGRRGWRGSVPGTAARGGRNA